MSDEPRLIFRVHAIQRMFERGITAADVRHVVATGDTIEDYPDDSPYPSRLMLGWIGLRPLHVVVGEDRVGQAIIVITVYEPASSRWSSDFKRRQP